MEFIAGRMHKKIESKRHFLGITGKVQVSTWHSCSSHSSVLNTQLYSLSLSLFLHSVLILIPCNCAVSLEIAFKTPRQKGCDWTILSLSHQGHLYWVYVLVGFLPFLSIRYALKSSLSLPLFKMWFLLQSLVESESNVLSKDCEYVI